MAGSQPCTAASLDRPMDGPGRACHVHGSAHRGSCSSTADHDLEGHLGNTVQEWTPSAAANPGDIPVQTLALHHSVRELPSGNLLALGATRRSIVDFPTSATNPNAPPKTQMVMGDEILEIQPDGTVAWRWDSFDHLDPYRIGYTAFNQFWSLVGFPDTRDWTHGNTLVVDPSDGSVIFGMRAQSAIVKVDRDTGELRWILGDPTSWNAPQANLLLTPVGDFHWSYCHHGPSLTPQGTLLVYNNDFHRAIPYQPRPAPSTAHSRAIEYAVDEQTMTVQEVWSSALPGETALVGWAMGDAKWMPKKGNVLVSYGAVVPVGNEQTAPNWGAFGLMTGTWSRIAEFTHQTPPNVVWELIIKDTSMPYPTGWESYHVERRPKLSKAEEPDDDDDAVAPSAL